MDTFKHDGKTYKVVPEKVRGSCEGCALNGSGGGCHSMCKSAADSGQPECGDGVIYRQVKKLDAAKIARAKTALKAALQALDDLEKDQ